MGKYRKKPVVIEAMQFTDETKDRVFNWITTTCYPGFDESNNPVLVVQTLEGDMRVSLGDWVIKGVKGEFYPCKADIFEAIYEAVEDTQPGDFWEQYGITRNLQLVEARAELEALRAQAQPPPRVDDGERQLSTPHWVAASANDLGAIEAMLAGVNNPANHAHVRLWLRRAWQDAQHTPQPLPGEVRKALHKAIKTRRIILHTETKSLRDEDMAEVRPYLDEMDMAESWLAQQPAP